MRFLNLPDTPSDQVTEDGQMFAPSAARNADAIETILHEFLPTHGRVLEIASGTGQHIAQFATSFPDLSWVPSDPDPARRASITAHCTSVSVTNVSDPIDLVATTAEWPDDLGQFDAILLVNLFHLISEAEAKQLIANVARALAPQGHFILYGPFTRADDFVSEGDTAFHASLVAQDPDIGYKDDFDVIEWLMDAWLDPKQVIEMPANNLTIVAQKF